METDTDPNTPSTQTQTPAPDLSIQDKQRHFHNILIQAELQHTLPAKKTGDKKNEFERNKNATETSSDAINDTIVSLKADLGIMHETVRIKTVEIEKLTQYCNFVELDLVNTRDPCNQFAAECPMKQAPLY